ncbi:MAG: 4Fe-4S binding protein [Anaerolineae bacterium]
MQRVEELDRVFPTIDHTICILCGDCVASCPRGALAIRDDRVVLDKERCVYCGDCEDVCPVNAIALPYTVVWASESGPSSKADGGHDHG